MNHPGPSMSETYRHYAILEPGEKGWERSRHLGAKVMILFTEVQFLQAGQRGPQL